MLQDPGALLEALQAQAAPQLAELQRLIAAVQARVALSGEQRLPEILAEHRPAVAAAMDGFGVAIASFLAAGPTEEQITASREQFAAPLMAWMRTSPVFQRGLQKPGESGADPEIGGMVLAGRAAGADVASQVLSDYLLNTVTAQAYRNRVAALVRRVQEEVARRAAGGAGLVRILSLHTDSGLELPLMAREARFAAAAHVTCADDRTEALRGAYRVAAPVLVHGMRIVRVHPLQFATSPIRPKWSYEVVYCLSLAPHLSDVQVSRLIRNSWGLMVHGGMMILGTSTPGIPAAERALDVWLVRWQQHYRDEGDWRRLFAGTPFGADGMRFELEPLAANALVVATRE